MFIPEDVIEKVRESNDIVDVISEYVALKKKGRNFFGLCPFHSEKTPSFSVQQDKQIYHCFGCGEGGNVISFLMKYRKVDFIDAVTMLAERANITIPSDNREFDSDKIDLKNKLYDANREAARYFYMNLKRSAVAVEYFKSRGIGWDIIRKFGLGYSPEGWDRILKHLASKGYSEDIIEKAGLIIKSEKSTYYDRFRNRVMFPVFDVKNRIIGFGGRVMDDSKPKYLNSSESLIFNKGSNLYGLNICAKNDINRKIIIVEGYMDVIALHQYGIGNAVASLGTALTKEQAKLLKRYCDEVIICYDSDTAGQAATLRGLDVLASAGLSCYILEIPKGKDPDEFIRSEGREAFIECVEKALPLIDYRLKRKNEGFDISTVEGKIGFIKSSAEELVTIDDPIVVDAYINKISNNTGIAVSALYDELKRQKKLKEKTPANDGGHINGKSRYNNNIDGQKLYLENAVVKAEKSILCIICESKEHFKLIEKKLSCEDFIDDVYRKVACMLYKKLSYDEKILPAQIISCFDNPEDMKKVSDIFNNSIIIDNHNILTVIEDCINLIRKHKLTVKKALLNSRMREYVEKGEVQQSAQLLKEILEIEKQLRMQ